MNESDHSCFLFLHPTDPEEEEEEGSEQDENTGHVEPPPSTKTGLSVI